MIGCIESRRKNGADVIFRLVRTLNFGYRQSGYYTEKQIAAYWDGRNERGEKAASGVYYYSIQAGDFSAVKKLILME